MHEGNCITSSLQQRNRILFIEKDRETGLFLLPKASRCPFVLYVGHKKLVKRKEFERFISENVRL
ncbi:MAG: hypothetical protein IJ805_04590 [Lachnospiraceae bacterium]|nr:hypothetical protein [Lachnospiraceae bacterium]